MKRYEAAFNFLMYEIDKNQVGTFESYNQRIPVYLAADDVYDLLRKSSLGGNVTRESEKVISVLFPYYPSGHDYIDETIKAQLLFDSVEGFVLSFESVVFRLTYGKLSFFRKREEALWVLEQRLKG